MRQLVYKEICVIKPICWSVSRKHEEIAFKSAINRQLNNLWVFYLLCIWVHVLFNIYLLFGLIEKEFRVLHLSLGDL